MGSVEATTILTITETGKESVEYIKAKLNHRMIRKRADFLDSFCASMPKTSGVRIEFTPGYLIKSVQYKNSIINNSN
jgi:hypothetical protein